MTLFHHQTGQLRTWVRRVMWFVFVVGSLCAVVIPIFLIYRREGDGARSVVEVGPQGVSHTGDYIHVVGSVASVDFEDKNFRVHFEFTPHGTLAGDDGVLIGAVSVSLFYTTLSFPDSQIMRSVDVTMPYMQGATIDYPFDAYKSYFEILANKDREQLHRIPVSLTFLGMLQTVEFVPVVHLDPSDTYKISIEIFTKRSPTTIGFSLFIVMIMWALSIAIGIIAIQVIRNHRIPDEHILTLGIATLFALPALRETQPGIPAIGCAADVLGFYWNMAIIAISSIMILMASALRWKEPSIEKEIELVHQQHDFQSKLISEMAIPMPFPLTGGPFCTYQVKKKRMPFVMSRDLLPRSPLSTSGSSLAGSPLYSDGGHEYHHSTDGRFYCMETGHVYGDGESESEYVPHQGRQQKEGLAKSSSESASTSSSEPRRAKAGEASQRRPTMQDLEQGSLFSGSVSLPSTGHPRHCLESLSSISTPSSSSSGTGIESKPPNPSSLGRVTSESIYTAEHRPHLVRQSPLRQLHLPLYRTERTQSVAPSGNRLPTPLEEEEEEEPPRYATGWNSSAMLPHPLEDLERFRPPPRQSSRLGFRSTMESRPGDHSSIASVCTSSPPSI
ncbi:hypothetical protein BG006_005888 [Podila minutissima]|uniref:Uncharacterized protein n=1 Tax=Podila minutissima TaxID=64525 RepID=A0A9P5SJH8_9FUNG|nr:hypothetical protein BG006_005888 [Podila minutissima]